jgi:hypothetical protein
MPKVTCPQGMEQKFWDRWLGLKMADEAVGLADSQAVLKAHREATQATLRAQAEQVRTMFGGDNKGSQSGDADSDMIHIGDLTQTITHQAPKASKLGALGKLAIGAGLLATGAGAGIGIPLLLSGAKDMATQAPTINVQDGIEYQFDLVPAEGK